MVGSPTIRVALLREGSEIESRSMRLYADHLARALSAPELVAQSPDWARGRASRLDRYLTRYWRIPQRLVSDSDVYHIVDHANSHWIRRLAADRTVVTCHDLMLLKLLTGDVRSREGTPLLAAAAFRWSVSHLPQAAAVVCDSNATRDDARRLLGCAPERLHVVYPGLATAFRPLPDRSEMRAQLRRSFGVTAPVMLLHVGHRFFYKNVEGLLHALAWLVRKGRNSVQLVRVGEDLTADQQGLIRRLGLTSHVRLVGAVGLGDLVRLYNAADALVYPSLAEGFGWPIVEAMACGTPVVCSARGALAEVAGTAASLVDPEDPVDIAQGVTRVLDDEPFRRELVQRGLDRSRAFGWDEARTRLRALYVIVAEGSGHSLPPSPRVRGAEG